MKSPGCYAVYKGDDFICLGTVKECAKELGVKEDTIRFYMTPVYKKRMTKSSSGNYIEVFRVEDDE